MGRKPSKKFTAAGAEMFKDLTWCMLVLLALCWVVLAMVGCSYGPKGVADDNLYHYNNYQNQFWPLYKVEPSVIVDNIQVDTSGLDVDLTNGLTRQTNEVEECLRETIGLDHIVREWVEVKVVPNAFLSKDSTQELIPGSGHPEECVAKKLCSTTKDCDCYLRAGIQMNTVLVVTPSFFLYKDALIRYVSGINNPWTGPVAKCAAPTVPSLSGLVQ